MSYADVNGFSLIEAQFVFPLWGRWHLDAVIDSPAPLQGACSVNLDNVLTLSGWVQYGGPYLDSLRVRIVAGKGGFERPCVPKFYQGASVKAILTDLLTIGGESLSPTSNAAALGIVPKQWATFAGTVGANVKQILTQIPATANVSARFLSDGSFFVGPETWQPYGLDYVAMDESPIERRMELGLESPTVIAGQTVQSINGTVRKINRVESQVSGSGIRATAWWQDG